MTENQQAWVDALRSGEFKQCRYSLNHDGGYCCLGVLCVVAEKHGVEVNRLRDRLLGSTLKEQPAAQEWIGLPTYNGGFAMDSNGPRYLTELNDDGKSFAEIADIIEQNADSLFTQNVPN